MSATTTARPARHRPSRRQGAGAQFVLSDFAKSEAGWVDARLPCGRGRRAAAGRGPGRRAFRTRSTSPSRPPASAKRRRPEGLTPPRPDRSAFVERRAPRLGAARAARPDSSAAGAFMTRSGGKMTTPRSLSHLRGQAELSAVKFDEPLDDRQPESRPLLGVLVRQRPAAERRQDDRYLFRRNAGAGVPDRHVLPARAGPPDLDRRASRPAGVNLMALVRRLRVTWRTARSSAQMRGRSRRGFGERQIAPFLARIDRSRQQSCTTPGSDTASSFSSYRPASTRDRSRISLISIRRCWPLTWMSLEYSL